jgi:hypothetical protein
VQVPAVGWWSSDDPRRRAAFVALVLAGAAVVGLGTGSVLGMTDDNPSSPSPSPTPTPSVTKRAASEIERGTTSDIGYFLKSEDKADGRHVTFDRVLLLSGKEAKAYAKAHHTEKPKKDGVLVVNDNALTRDLVLSPDVRVQGSQQLAGSANPQPVSLQTLLDTVASNGSDLLLDLTYDDLGYVTRVKEHVLP